MKQYDILGLMSGTSLDGLDLACCRFELTGNQWNFRILAADTFQYTDDLYHKLQNCMELSGYELSMLNLELGNWMGKKTLSFIKLNNLSPQLIASHGHTVFHQPERHLTLQIGDAHVIHKICGIPVVYNFRNLDVLCGGQGAPLVPIGDQLLFHEYTFCLNLGGISNISFDNVNGERIAFDICPVNMVLNELAKITGKSYDENGNMARNGKLIPEILQSLNALKYYDTPPPKSLGKEWVMQEILPILDTHKYDIANLLHTFCHHIAKQINDVIRPANLKNNMDYNVLVTGGGAFNAFLIELMHEYSLGPTKFTLPAQNIIEYKEAVVFAFIGLLRHLNKPNILKSVTGASTDTCSGDIVDNLNIG